MCMDVAIIITKRPPIKVEVGVAKEGMEEGDMEGDRGDTEGSKWCNHIILKCF